MFGFISDGSFIADFMFGVCEYSEHLTILVVGGILQMVLYYNEELRESIFEPVHTFF